MLRNLLRWPVRKLERDFAYDASYVHEMIDASPGAGFKFALFQLMSGHRQDVPKAAWYAAKIAATVSEDCGPCTQLIVDAALRDGVPEACISPLLLGNPEEAGPDAAFGFRYGSAVATNAPEAVQIAGEALTRYGRRGLVSLSFAVASSRVYPALKRGLGHGAACSRIVVSGEAIMVKKAA